MKKLFAAAIVCIVLLAACGGAATDEAQIEGTFNKLASAMKSGDYATVKEMLGDNAPAEEEFKMMAGFMKEINMNISDIKVDGDTATATVKMTGTVMGQEMDQSTTANFKKVDGKWVAEEMAQN